MNCLRSWRIGLFVLELNWDLVLKITEKKDDCLAETLLQTVNLIALLTKVGSVSGVYKKRAEDELYCFVSQSALGMVLHQYS